MPTSECIRSWTCLWLGSWTKELRLRIWHWYINRSLISKIIWIRKQAILKVSYVLNGRLLEQAAVKHLDGSAEGASFGGFALDPLHSECKPRSIHTQLEDYTTCNISFTVLFFSSKRLRQRILHPRPRVLLVPKPVL